MKGIHKILSGGQTGVDRGALNAALRLGVVCGGWCPRGRRAEDGCIPLRYPVTELASWVYADRTRRNVESADGTLILSHGALQGGTALTAAFAARAARPYLVLDLAKQPCTAQVIRWARANAVGSLNVAGPRESTAPGVGLLADTFMTSLLLAEAVHWQPGQAA